MFTNAELYINDVRHTAKANLPWHQLENKAIMITGASGMIGTFLIDVLMEKNKTEQLNVKIYAIGRNIQKAKKRFAEYWQNANFFFIQIDVNQPLNFNFHTDYIIHAASNTHPVLYASDPVGSIMTNLLGTYNLFEYAKQTHLERFIFLSSVEIYGQALNEDDVFDESYCGYIDCNTVRAGYPEGKRASEALCNAYCFKYGIDVVIPRLARIYGPTMRLDDSKAMSQFLLNGVRGEDIVLKSRGMQLYSYCYVADAVLGIFYIGLLGEKGNAYNVCDVETKWHLKDITQYIAGITGHKVIFQLPDKSEQEGFSKVSVGVMSSDKLQKLGWQPHDNLESGIKKTLKILQKFM